MLHQIQLNIRMTLQFGGIILPSLLLESDMCMQYGSVYMHAYVSMSIP